MKVPDTPEELLRMVNHGDADKQCHCRLCTNIRHLEESGMSVQEMVSLVFVMLGRSMSSMESGIKGAIHAEDFRGAAALSNILGILYAATTGVGLVRNTLNDYSKMLDEEKQ